MAKKISDGTILLEKSYANLFDLADKLNSFVLVISRDLRAKFLQTIQVHKLKVAAHGKKGSVCECYWPVYSTVLE